MLAWLILGQTAPKARCLGGDVASSPPNMHCHLKGGGGTKLKHADGKMAAFAAELIPCLGDYFLFPVQWRVQLRVGFEYSYSTLSFSGSWDGSGQGAGPRVGTGSRWAGPRVGTGLTIPADHPVYFHAVHATTLEMGGGNKTLLGFGSGSIYSKVSGSTCVLASAGCLSARNDTLRVPIGTTALPIFSE